MSRVAVVREEKDGAWSFKVTCDKGSYAGAEDGLMETLEEVFQALTDFDSYRIGNPTPPSLTAPPEST